MCIPHKNLLTDHLKGASGLGQIRGHLEAGGGGSYHSCVFLKSAGTGGATVWGEDMGLVSGHGEVDSGGPRVFFEAGLI